MGLPPRAEFGQDFVCPLGQEDFDLWVYTQLCNAGVAVELIKNGGSEEEQLYQAVQIVDEVCMVRAFEEMNPVKITYCDWNDMLVKALAEDRKRGVAPPEEPSFDGFTCTVPCGEEECWGSDCAQ